MSAKPSTKAKTMAEALFVPWSVDGRKIIDDAGDVVCTTGMETEAAFIVECANAHDEMVQALKAAATALREHGHHAKWTDCTLCVAIATADAALALAGAP